MYISFLGLKVPRVGFLVAKDPSYQLETKKITLPGIIGWNLIWLAYQEFTKKHPIEVFLAILIDMVSKVDCQSFNKLLDGPVGTVKNGIEKDPMFIPGNAILTLPGKTSKIYKG